MSKLYVFNEQFKQLAFIADDAYGEVYVQVLWNNILVPRYYISNYGRLYDMDHHRFVTASVGDDGYYAANIIIKNIGDKKKNVRIHRLECMSFYPIPSCYNYSKYRVKMLDGNKTNLMLSNLAWETSGETTIQDNMYANKGNYYPNNRFKGNINGKMINVLNTSEPTFNNGSITANNLVNKIRYIDNQNLYHFDLNVIRDNTKFTYTICELLSDPNTYSFKDIMLMLNVPDREQIHVYTFICCLLNGDIYQNIASQYPNMKRPTNPEWVFNK